MNRGAIQNEADSWFQRLLGDTACRPESSCFCVITPQRTKGAMYILNCVIDTKSLAKPYQIFCLLKSSNSTMEKLRTSAISKYFLKDQISSTAKLIMKRTKASCHLGQLATHGYEKTKEGETVLCCPTAPHPRQDPLVSSTYMGGGGRRTHDWPTTLLQRNLRGHLPTHRQVWHHWGHRGRWISVSLRQAWSTWYFPKTRFYSLSQAGLELVILMP